MCGIFGYVGDKNNAPDRVLAGLKRLEYRGYDSWGVASIPDQTKQGKIELTKQVGKIGQAQIKMALSSFAFGHTRWATHGGVTVANAHPHLDCAEQTAVIHNGIIENYQQLKKKLTAKHTFRSETDTEVVAHLIEEALAQNQPLDQATLSVFRRLEGNNAIIVANSAQRQLVAAKNGSPLIIGLGQDGNYLASDPAALLPHTKTVHFLEDYQLAILTDDQVKLVDIKTGQPLPLKPEKLQWQLAQTTKGKYQYFMEKEMREQPAIINQIALQPISQTEKLVKLLKQHDDIIFVGCGTASYASWAASYLFSRIARKQVKWAIASEFDHLQQFVTKRTLIVAMSQSGETMDLIQIIKRAQASGAKVVAVVNVLGSTLYRMSDQQVLIEAGPEKAVASTKAFIGKLSHLVRLAYAYDGRFDEGQQILVETSRVAEQVLAPASWAALKKVATKLIKAERMFVIGRGVSNVTAAEVALKIKEISYIHAESIIGGELKHGPLALIEPGTPCIVIAPADEYYQATISSATEIKARGGYIIGLASQNHPVFDDWVKIPDVQEASIIPAVVTGQILAFQMTLLQQLDPDMPRNLAKSVTVG
jgi:glucosamine--fructose-6-phosphate aminotransferase (isomerizing)